ncbi:hypothetical protein RQP46_011070 [Phenoliferia psychrophenolica]
MALVLNWAGTGPLTTLTLPISKRPLLAARDATLRLLALPNLRELILAVMPMLPCPLTSPDKPVTYMDYHPILTNPVRQDQLIHFLESITVPILNVLCLRGWANHSGVSIFSLPPTAPVVLALPPQEGSSLSDAPAMDDSKMKNPFIVKLLAQLRTMGVRKLRLENSVDHPDAGTCCVFSRKGDAEWVSEIVLS